MRSSSRFGSRLVMLAVVLVATSGIAALRAPLVATFTQARERSDVYALPKPEQMVVASLGYRSALADLLFAHVLIWHGIHFQEKRRFEFAADYLDTVTALDPSFRDPYDYGDTLIAMQPTKPRHEDYVRARRLLERGMDLHPLDTELWLTGGQFMAYVAAPWLDDPKEQAEWRLAGARRLARACELVGSNENIPFNCITAATLFSRAGEREAMIQFLERVLAVSDDDAIRELALRYLGRAASERDRERIEMRADELRAALRADLPFASVAKELVVGPPFEPARCAGGNASRECATTWAEWRARVDSEVR